MQISEKLPQFEDTPTLLIVAGGQTARFFFAEDGMIDELDMFTIENPKYADREGHFQRSAHGEVYGSGSVYEKDDNAIKNEFYRALQNTLETMSKKHPFDEVILCAPPHSIKETEEHIQPQFRDRITQRITGNFTQEHPTELLKRLGS